MKQRLALSAGLVCLVCLVYVAPSLYRWWVGPARPVTPDTKTGPSSPRLLEKVPTPSPSARSSKSLVIAKEDDGTILLTRGHELPRRERDQVKPPERTAIPETPSNLVIPVEGIRPSELLDTFDDPRSGGRAHLALDIMAPRSTPILAATDGVIRHVLHSELGGLAIYQLGPRKKLCFYYAHLEDYARGLKEGDRVERGQVIGYVGSTGNAPDDAPHLHFAISRPGPGKGCWNGEPINPYPILSPSRE